MFSQVRTFITGGHQPNTFNRWAPKQIEPLFVDFRAWAGCYGSRQPFKYPRPPTIKVLKWTWKLTSYQSNWYSISTACSNHSHFPNCLQRQPYIQHITVDVTSVWITQTRSDLSQKGCHWDISQSWKQVHLATAAI